jgi:uncharacterized oxidoreductase
LVAGIKSNQFTIRVGITKMVYLANRLFPRIAYGLVNPAKNARQLQS